MAAPAAARDERYTVTPETFRKIVDATLALFVLIVASGAAVRLTGSGLGCPDWPSCHGRVVPTLDTPTAIEYGNRLISGLIGVPSLAMAVLVFRLRPFRRDLVVPALALPAGVGAQGILGGLTVIFDLHWQLVIAHYLLSMTLLVPIAVLLWRVRRPADAAPIEHPRRLVGAVRFLVVYGALIIVLGTFATAAGPHAGGDATDDVVVRLTAIGLTTMIKIHGHLATWMAISAIGVWLYARHTGASPLLRRILTAACLLVAAQGALGLLQYHLELPPEIVWAHASLAALLWLTFLFSWMAAGRAAT
jgi:cytochrome c oxidase assembly protein subunit 15